MPQYIASKPVYVDRRYYPAGAIFITNQTPDASWRTPTSSEIAQAAADAASPGLTALSASLTTLSSDPGSSAVIKDPNNASFSGAVQLVAGTDYSAQGFRAINVTATSTGSCNFTLIDGSVLPYTLAAGPTYQLGLAIKSVDTIPSGCTLYGLK